MTVPKKETKPKVIILDNNPLSIACYLEEFGYETLEELEEKLYLKKIDHKIAEELAKKRGYK